MDSSPIKFCCKPTHIEQYLHVKWHHHMNKKIVFLNTLTTRSVRILDENHLVTEKTHFLELFMKYGYKKHQVINVIKNLNKLPKSKYDIKNSISKVCLPYIHETNHKISNIVRKKNIPTTFKPIKDIHSQFSFIKGFIDPTIKRVLYLIPCSRGKTYVGETDHCIKIRV